jgi:hypothetical protein
MGGGLNGSTQHWLEIYLLDSQKLISTPSGYSIGTLPCSGLIKCSLKNQFRMSSTVGSTD